MVLAIMQNGKTLIEENSTNSKVSIAIHPETPALRVYPENMLPTI